MSDEVVAALAKALPKIANPSKDGTSHHGKYATLAAMLDHVKPVLEGQGLAVLQRACDDGIQTLFVHSSGGVFDAGTYHVAQLTDPQKQGSAWSYGRRYALMAALGVAGADDDGNAAVPSKTSGPRMASAAQIKAIQAGMGDAGINGREDRLG